MDTDGIKVKTLSHEREISELKQVARESVFEGQINTRLHSQVTYFDIIDDKVFASFSIEFLHHYDGLLDGYSMLSESKYVIEHRQTASNWKNLSSLGVFCTMYFNERNRLYQKMQSEMNEIGKPLSGFEAVYYNESTPDKQKEYTEFIYKIIREYLKGRE